MILDRLIKRLPDEKMVIFVRRHGIFLFGDFLMIVFLASIPVGIWFALSKLLPVLVLHPIARPLVIMLLAIYVLFVWLFALINFVDYYLDGWIVTSHRILSVEQHGLFSRVVSELDLSRVQDVTSEEKGIFAFIFGYGTVYIQTAGEAKRFDFDQIPHPDAVRKQILELVEGDRKNDLQQAMKPSGV